MQSLLCDLANCPFVASPGSTVSALYEQYIRDLSGLLDKHAPTVTRTFTKGAAGWLSDTYLQAKAVRHQFERFWRKDKSPLNRARLRKQVARCNTLITRHKSNYYRNLISDNAHDSKKLWHVLRSVLHSVSDKVLPSHASHTGLASFVTFFSDKISKIRDSFTNTDSFTLPAPSDVPKFDLFKPVSEDEVRKVITKSPTKSCLLDPWPTFLVKECLDILLPSITKLVNCSLTEGAVPAGFKKAIVSPLIKKSSLPPDELKNYRPVSGLSFIYKLVERVVASKLNDHVTSNGLENVSLLISKVIRPKLHYCLLKTKSTLLLLEVKLLLLFSWTNQQHSTPLIIVRSLNV